MRQEAESKLLAQANSREPEVKLVKIRSGKGEYCLTRLKVSKLHKPTVHFRAVFKQLNLESFIIIIGGSAA